MKPVNPAKIFALVLPALVGFRSRNKTAEYKWLHSHSHIEATTYHRQILLSFENQRSWDRLGPRRKASNSFMPHAASWWPRRILGHAKLEALQAQHFLRTAHSLRVKVCRRRKIREKGENRGKFSPPAYYYCYDFIMASLFLSVAMIGAIVLTMHTGVEGKRQEVFA